MQNEFADITRLWTIVSTFVVQYALQILGAVVILLVGWWLAGLAGRGVAQLARRVHIDVTLAGFFAMATKVAVLTLAGIAALNNFGITVAPLIAAIGAAAFGVTVAVQGTLANLGAGAALILTRPFKVGDSITVKGVSGTVQEISLMSTVLTNDGGERIIVPNKQINGETLVCAAGGRVVVVAVPLPVAVAPDPAMAEIARTIAAVSGVASNPPVKIGIDALTGDGVTVELRYWVAAGADYLDVRHQANRALLGLLERLGARAPSGPRTSGEA